MAEHQTYHPLAVPSSFTHASQGNMTPTTPERSIQLEAVQPVSVPGGRFRLRRQTASRALSSGALSPPFAMAKLDTGVIIPSIEVAIDDSAPGAHPTEQGILQPTPGYLSPLSNQPYELPTTPVQQTVSFDGDSYKTARQRLLGELITRPASVCSNFSTSSDESEASSTFASSYGGTTCTSPERSSSDPFMTPSRDDKYRNFSESLMAAGQIPDLGGLPPRQKPSWTQAMDDHLWTTYQLYLQDPTMTPIKVVPGNPPPLGVCHRVARKARQTWREPRLRTTAGAAARFSTPQAESRVRRIEDITMHSQSDNEASGEANVISATWPKQNATRRRLRELTKNRATVPTHYMRMIASRSPSPFIPSSRASSTRHTISAAGARPPSNVSRHGSSRSFDMGTRGVRLALATATSETMQPDGPLARLQRDTPEPTPEASPRMHVPLNLAERAPSLSSMVPTSPTSIATSVSDYPMLNVSFEEPPRLGSPFVPNRNHTWTAPGRRQKARPAIAPTTFAHQEQQTPEETVRVNKPQNFLRPTTSTGPRSLRSPIQFTSTFPYNRSLGSKRRAEHSLEDIASPRHNSHRRPALNEVFGPPLEVPSREGACSPVEQRRVRLRGFSLNDAVMQDQQERQNLHMPPFAGLPENEDPFTDNGTCTSGSNLPGVFISAQAPRQLGSPFKASHPIPRPRFRVRHLAHNSLDSYPEGLFGSIGERLNRDGLDRL